MWESLCESVTELGKEKKKYRNVCEFLESRLGYRFGCTILPRADPRAGYRVDSLASGKRMASGGWRVGYPILVQSLIRMITRNHVCTCKHTMANEPHHLNLPTALG